MTKDVEGQYFNEGLYEDIIERLKEQGIDLNKVKRSDIAGVDEFHVRGAEVSKELAKSIDIKGASVLDVGCGLGGPCRMLADEYNCQAIGIDLSSEFIRTAKGLSKLVKLDNKTSFIKGDATNLPFDNNTFDAVWTQHVQMNIPDKIKFYSEIGRVLKPGGHFLYYDLFKKEEGEITFPMPWADNAELSFLFKKEEMDSILKNLGFTKELTKVQTLAGIEFFNALIAKLKESGPPKIGLNVIMGESTKAKIMNVLTHLKSGEIEIKSGVYKK
ncbi:MAG: class I SAM-dependent methyltransferase [Bacteroidota bacterium]